MLLSAAFWQGQSGCVRDDFDLPLIISSLWKHFITHCIRSFDHFWGYPRSIKWVFRGVVEAGRILSIFYVSTIPNDWAAARTCCYKTSISSVDKLWWHNRSVNHNYRTIRGQYIPESSLQRLKVSDIYWTRVTKEGLRTTVLLVRDRVFTTLQLDVLLASTKWSL
jgi:hypothetical protein